MDKNFQTVFKKWRTGLYGKTAWRILNWTICGMKGLDGVNGRAAYYLKTERACDGEITIVAAENGIYPVYRLPVSIPYNFNHCAFSRYDDGKFREYLASHVKRASKKVWSEWKRDSARELDCGDAERLLTVSDAYAVYDALKGRDIGRRFPKELVELVAGKPADPMTAELERARREAEEEAKRRYMNALDEIDRRYAKELDAAQCEWIKIRDKIKLRKSEAIAALDRSLSGELAEIDKELGLVLAVGHVDACEFLKNNTAAAGEKENGHAEKSV